MSKKSIMKPTRLDKLIGIFNPKSMQNRMIARYQNEQLIKREFYSGDSSIKTPKSVNKQMSGKITYLREDIREVVRKSAFAKKGVDVIVNGVVGWGIHPIISHPDQKVLDLVNKEWELWSKSLCSIDGKSDFYTLQQRAMAGIIIDGEVIGREVIDEKRSCVSIQLLEADHLYDKIDSTIHLTAIPEDLQKKGVARIVAGIAVDQYSRPVAYFILKNHPGDNYGYVNSGDYEVVLADKIIHPYRTDRIGQIRGISWLHQSAEPLRHLVDLQDAHLMKMTLNASLTAVITKDPSLASASDVINQMERDAELSPGTMYRLQPGEKVEFPSIPNADGFDGSTRLALIEAAAGMGITYELLSGDLSRVNFSSGRLGDLQFRANIENWRWHMLIPQFLNPAFEKFKKHLALKGIRGIDQIKVNWVPPSRQMVDPEKEVRATKEAIRAGLMSYKGALIELGIDPESHVKEIVDSNKMLDENKIIIDSDPRYVGNGQLNSVDSLSLIEAGKVKKEEGEE